MVTDTQALLDIALTYLERGFPIFPVCTPIPVKPGWCVQHRDHAAVNEQRIVSGRQALANPGKHPLVSWGAYQRRLPTEDEVRDWWTRWPSANIGLVTGALSGRVVLDSDGFDAYTAVLSRGGVEPTPTVVTGKPNGFHWYLKHPGRTVRNFAGDRGVTGLDFRGDGGYVVLPPSLHQTGAFYTWHADTELLEPRAVPPWLLDMLTDTRPSNDTEAQPLPIDVEGVLRGVPEGQRDDTLYRTACRLRADAVPIEYAELLIRHAAHNCSPPFPSEVAVAKVREAYRQFKPTITLSGSVREADTPSLPEERFRLLTPAEMKCRTPPEPLIDGILFLDSTASLSGPQATFKSFLALDMALCVAAGCPWQGFDTTLGPVVYISAEGSSGIKWRIEAWEAYHEVPAPETCLFLPEAVQLLRAGDVDAVIHAIETTAPRPVCVIVDTLARTMQGGDENSAKDMGLWIAGADRIRQATGACVLVIHHVNKAGTSRGSTALPGALNTMMNVRRDGDMVTIECEKQKDAEEFHELNLTKKLVDIGDGKTSLVFENAMSEASPLTEMNRKIALILFDTFGLEGATATQWQQVCEEAKVSRASFFRAKRELVEKGIVQAQKHGNSARFATVNLSKVSSVSEESQGAGDTNRKVGIKVSHPFRGDTLIPSADTDPSKPGSCPVCDGTSWRQLRDGWVCAECFPGFDS